MSAVFDASVIVKWFVDDPLTSAAMEARLAYKPALAPSLAVIEVANALRRYVVRGELEMAAAQDDLALIPMAVDLLKEEEFADESFGLACRLNHSMTDCLYAIIARRRNLPLITADAKLARKLSVLEGLDIRMLVVQEDSHELP